MKLLLLFVLTYLPEIAESEVGKHDPNNSQLVREAWRDPEVHPGAKVLRVEQGQKDQGTHGSNGPYAHDS